MAGWLRDEIGVRVPLGPAGTLIGRSAACSVVVDDPEVSRRHLLILHGEGGTQLIPLGRRQALFRRSLLERPMWVDDGDELVVARARFVFELRPVARTVVWVLEMGGHVYPASRFPFSIGGGVEDDLHIEGWQPHCATLFQLEGQLRLEPHGPLAVDGVEEIDGFFTLSAGATIRFERGEVRVVQAADAPATVDRALLPTGLSLELVPNGGLLRVEIDSERLAFLPHKRADLVAALLQPIHGVQPGEWVPDQQLFERIWGSEGGTRVQLNTLIHRTRVSLSEAGLDGSALIERAPGGGATRFRCSRGATVKLA